MKIKFLSLFGLIAVCLGGSELLLEARAARRGYDTLLFGAAQTVTSSPGRSMNAYGPTSEFPFRSRIVPRVTAPGTVRIWIASASYAQDLWFPPDRVFPSIAAQLLAESTTRRIEVLNRSEAGLSIPGNLDHLRLDGDAWHPDIIVLYQLTNDLNQLTRSGGEHTGDGYDPASNPTSPRALTKLYERTTWFAHLKANVTPKFSGSRLLPGTLSDSADAAFQNRIRTFLNIADSLGAIPVLMTFATRIQHADSLDTSARDWLLRWNPDLSPEGYVRTVSAWNRHIRQIAEQEAVPIIDVESQMRGRSDLFRDFAHFERDGHTELARIVAAALLPLIEKTNELQ